MFMKILFITSGKHFPQSPIDNSNTWKLMIIKQVLFCLQNDSVSLDMKNIQLMLRKCAF